MINWLEKLCYYDVRNPDGVNADGIDPDEIQRAKDNCSCDNCFYGRTEMALEHLESEEKKIAFTKLHVEAALRAAAIRACVGTSPHPNGKGGIVYNGSVDKESILNAYPLNNIK